MARIGASDQPCVGRRAHEHDTHKQNTCSDARAAPFVPQACITARKTGKTGWRIIRRILKAGERKTLPIFGKYDYKLLFAISYSETSNSKKVQMEFIDREQEQSRHIFASA